MGKGGVSMERLSELEMNSIGFAILCNFPRFCGEERAKEASGMFQAMKGEIMAYRTLGPVEELSALVKARDEGPCSLCRYSPPSSCDGKPCTMCPAEGVPNAEAEAALGGGGDG